MDIRARDGAPAPYWSLAGVREGAVAVIPGLPGVIVFSASFGALAAQKGVPLAETVLMSAVVSAGVSQFLAMEMWGPSISILLLTTIVTTTLVVNLRLSIPAAALQPWIAGSPAWLVYPSLFMTTITNWIPASRYRASGGADVGFLFGGGLVCWLTWVGATAAGQIFGGLITDPKRYAIDLILPLYFVALLTPTYKGIGRSIPWAVAGAVALLMQQLMPGYWYLIAGVVCGAMTAGLMSDE
jgi:predicted branched-subunit amino acid permease